MGVRLGRHALAAVVCASAIASATASCARTGTAQAVAPTVAASIQDGDERLKATPFKVLVPARLPDGARLVRVQSNPAAGGGDVDLEYLLSDGRRLHLWETTRSSADLQGKDPTTLTGAIHQATQAAWLEGTGFSGRVVTLSARIGNILVSVDASMSAAELLEIADSVR